MSRRFIDPTLDEVRQAAVAAITIFEAAGLKTCLVGSLACKAYGMKRTPSDVDLVVLSASHTQEQLKDMLVAGNVGFYLVRAKTPGATYRVLWFRQFVPGKLFSTACKVDVLQPGIMNIPFVPTQYIVYMSQEGPRLPVMPFLPLLLLKLQAWSDHRAAFKSYLVVKQHVDVLDITELLELAMKYMKKGEVETTWIPESFMVASKNRVKEYVRSFPRAAKQWGKIGFAVK